MAIKRYENLIINTVANSVDAVGAYTTTLTKWFDARGLIANVSNAVRISEKYRVYQDLVNITFNYTPNMKTIVDDQNLYSLNWRGEDWRITDAHESNDRMSVTLMCYRSDPTTSV